MKRKLSLSPDQLRVDGFETAEREKQRGTVRARDCSWGCQDSQFSCWADLSCHPRCDTDCSYDGFTCAGSTC